MAMNEPPFSMGGAMDDVNRDLPTRCRCQEWSVATPDRAVSNPGARITGHLD
jgi:hypothetical protein